VRYFVKSVPILYFFSSKFNFLFLSCSIVEEVCILGDNSLKMHLLENIPCFNFSRGQRNWRRALRLIKDRGDPWEKFGLDTLKSERGIRHRYRRRALRLIKDRGNPGEKFGLDTLISERGIRHRYRYNQCYVLS
jgi:hypothetical protein